MHKFTHFLADIHAHNSQIHTHTFFLPPLKCWLHHLASANRTMGKASKWFRGLLGLKKPDSTSSSSPSQPSITSKPPPKKRWSFVKSYREKDHHQNFQNKPIQRSPTGVAQSIDSDDTSKHALAVAEATRAVAEAAVAAAEAAAAVVRLTTSGRAITTTATATTMSTSSFGNGPEVAPNSPPACLHREEWAAVKIQSHFRAYLSRRALRALKALVRLQALVRGHIVRKYTADVLQKMLLVRAQARARTGRSQIFESPLKSNQFNYHPGPATPEKFEHMIRARSMKHGENLMFRRNSLKSNGKVTGSQDKARMGSNWMDSETDVRSWEREGSSMKTNSREDERSDKILEVDSAKPHTVPKRRNLFHSCHLSLGSDQCSHSFTTSKESTAHQTALSPSSCEVQSFSPIKFSQDVDEEPYCTADNSPYFYSASSKGGATNRGPFTPTKSDCSKSCLSGYSDHPSYMAYTESSKAKMRSLSAPKQRPQYERSSSTKRYSVHGYGDSRMTTQKVSSLHANFANKAYPGSGRLDRLGMPVREELINFSGGHWHRY